MKTLYLDCLSGAAGDMVVAALVDLGVEHRVIRDAVQALGLNGVDVEFTQASRQQISGARFRVLVDGRDADGDAAAGHRQPDPAAAHSHAPGHEHGRSYREIRRLIECSGLDAPVRRRALAVFARIATAEAGIHGLPVEEIAFHEVGGEDSICDVVAACTALDALGPERVVCSRLFEGSGWIDCAHGRFPLPAPATAEILKGIPLRQIDEPYEFVTPTGAALVAEFASEFGNLPEMAVERIGYGVGSRDLPSRPNVLRAMLGCETGNDSGLESDQVTLIESNIDDMSPELAAAAVQCLLDHGALDAWITPVQMKKGRPGYVIAALATVGKAERLAGVLLAETSAFGVRMHEAGRLKYPRRSQQLETPYGTISVKLAINNQQVVKATPEFDDIKAAAIATGHSTREVMQAACAAAQSLVTRTPIPTPQSPTGETDTPH